MKKLLICSLWLALATSAGAAMPATFDEFKHLSPQEQYNLVAESDKDVLNPMYWKLLNWWERLHVGEERWQWQQEERLIDENNHTALASFFNTYQQLREECQREEWTRKNAQGISPSQQPEQGRLFDERAKADALIYHNIVPLLASLAPSAEAQALNDQAQQFSLELERKYPNVIPREEMNAVDQRVQALLGQLKKLPTLTSAQEQAEIDALPEKRSILFGIPYPHKQ